MNFGFPAKERLKSKKQIEHLFESGQSVVQYPLKAWFLPVDADAGTKVAFAVPKKSFKRAVDRNRIKRQMREAYRLNKANWDKGDNEYHVLLLYMDKQMPAYRKLEHSMLGLLNKLV